MFGEDVVFLCSSSGMRLPKTSNIKHSFKKNKALHIPEFVTELVLTAKQHTSEAACHISAY